MASSPKPAKMRKLKSNPSYIRMMLIAKSGFGKTVFGGSAPNAVFITTDPEGSVSAKRITHTEAEEMPCSDWQDVEDVYLWLRNGGIEDEGLEWVIVDDATNVQGLAMKKSIDARMARRADGDPWVPEQADYQRAQNGILDFVRRMNDLPINILYLSHRKGMEDGDGQDYYTAAIQGQQGQVAEQILGYMNIVAMGEVVEKEGEEHRRYFFTHHGPYRGKDRFVALGKARDDLTIPKMMEIVMRDPAAKRPSAKKTTAKRRTAAAV